MRTAGDSRITADAGADVVVVGGGPAGIAAAIRASESGGAVVLLDEGVATGGQIWRHTPTTDAPAAARPWLARLERCGARILSGTTVSAISRSAPGGDGARAALLVEAEQDGRPRRLHARAVVLATGARERFLPFPGWTLPGVVGIGGAQALRKSGASLAGTRVVIAGSGPLLLPVAATLAQGGASVLLVAEQASGRAVRGVARSLWHTPTMLVQAARYRAAFARTPYRTGTWVTTAHGETALQEVTLTDGRRHWSLRCDLLCTGYGLVPNLALAQLLGCRTEGGAIATDPYQATDVPGVYAAGEGTGVGGVALALLEGEIAGLAASGRRPEAARLSTRRAHAARAADRLQAAFAVRPELATLATPETIVCRCEDVTLGALDPAWSWRAAKLYTRVGMGPCQGRVCGPALETLFGWTPDSVRPPALPVRVATLAAGPCGGPPPETLSSFQEHP